MINIILLFSFGVFLGNISEFIIHKYFLHGLGKKKKSLFSSHWYRHHQTARKNNFYDKNYESIKNNKIEIFQLLFLILLFLPIYWLSGFIFLGAVSNAIAYFFIHRHIHLNPEIGKKYFKWHWEHHMGKNQDMNWCVTLPITDFILSKLSRNIKSK